MLLLDEPQADPGPAVAHAPRLAARVSRTDRPVRSRGAAKRARTGRLRHAALVSVCLHAAAFALLLVWLGHGREPGIVDPDSLPAVELVMVEQQGSGPTTASPVPAPDVPQSAAPEAPPPPPPEPKAPPDPKAPPAVEAPIAPPVPQAEVPPPAPAPPPPATANPVPPLPSPPAPPPAPAAAPAPHPASPPSPPATEAPEINLGGTDSETNAIASGPNIIPASVDAQFHNKQPVYPFEAVRHAQQGAVMLVVHVSPFGLPDGVDVAVTSGYAVLDRAARDAVANWHFLPAVKDGRPIPFDMKLRVMFQLD